MAEPKLLILDEPSLGLSPLLVEELFALIKSINAPGHRAAAGRAERGAEPRGGATRLCARQRRDCAAGKRGRRAQRSEPEARVSWNVTMAETLRARLAAKPIVVAPGVYDAFTALVATQAGFETLYVSGAAIAYTRLGRPDIGLVSMSEVAETITLIRDRVGAHLIVDADTGYGNALNVVRTVRAFERAGASAIQLEDQDFPETLRPSRRQGADPGRRDGRQDQGRARHARLARHADHRAHRRGRGRRLRARDRARRALPGGRRRHAVRRGAEDARRARARRQGAARRRR